MRDREQKKQPNWLSLAVIFLLIAPQVTIPIAICAGIGYLVFTLVKNGKVTPSEKKAVYTKSKSAIEDCPKSLFCFHKDKGEHHVARGKEMDPWDRPDIDISKYQQNR